VTYRALAFILAVGAGVAFCAAVFPLAARAGVALCAAVFPLAVRAGVALRALAFQLAVRSWVARHAAVFPLAVRARGAHRALSFQLPVRAKVARCAVAFQLAVSTGVALRAATFAPAVRAGVALGAAVFPLPMPAPLPSHHARSDASPLVFFARLDVRSSRDARSVVSPRGRSFGKRDQNTTESLHERSNENPRFLLATLDKTFEGAGWSGRTLHDAHRLATVPPVTMAALTVSMNGTFLFNLGLIGSLGLVNTPRARAPLKDRVMKSRVTIHRTPPKHANTRNRFR
jgi:hypothetical protein